MVCQSIVSQNSIELPTLACTVVAAGVKTFGSLFRCERRMEAWAGIEPAIELLQSSALPLGYHAAFCETHPSPGRTDRFAIVD